MKFTKEHTVNGISTVLALMFFYAAFSKLINYEQSRQEMLNQVFPRFVALDLVWIVPLLELVVVFSLLNRRYKLKGMEASFILLVIFSAYISVTMTGVFGRIPCSCGGILRHMGYWTHLAFNFFFIALALLGIALEKRWEAINRWFNFQKEEGGNQK